MISGDRVYNDDDDNDDDDYEEVPDLMTTCFNGL